MTNTMVGSTTMIDAQHRKTEYEFSMTEYASYLPDFQEDKMKNSSCDSLGISCTRLGWSHPMI